MGSAIPHQMVLDLNTLKDLDFGKINETFKRELQRCVEDCADRPLDDKARTVALIFKLTPDVDKGSQDLSMSSVDVQAHIKSSVPVRMTKVYKMLPTQNGGLKFNPDLPLEPEEASLYQEPFPEKR